ncbi:MAG: ankyrin repeat domain-containing protein [Tannerellaceae bacterium]|nr:ankyrin repeat domain-containing protein [Tannerellaceae bacterium]
MKKLFVAIRANDLETVKELLAKKPELISCTAKQPPKKDDGQSPLQVAVKAGSFDIANYLLDLGADVNFIDKDSSNEWKAPVVMDAVVAAVIRSRFTASFDSVNYHMCSTKEQADGSFAILERMVKRGADINARDTYGFSAFTRAVWQARELLPSYNYQEDKLQTDRLMNEEIIADFTRIFNLLIANGADKEDIKAMYEKYKKEPVSRFLIKE